MKHLKPRQLLLKKMIEKLNSRQTKIVHLNAPENTCRVGFWSIYSELHPLEGISVPPLDVFDSYSSIQSLDLYTIDISFTNPQLSQVSIQRGESFEINTTISSSEHNCAEIRVPVRILIEPVEQSELGISGLVQEIFIPIQF